MSIGSKYNATSWVSDIPDDEPAVHWLLESPRNPYYIVTPRYIRTSAGIRILHMLCHSLNRAGERAYLISHPYYIPEYAANPAFQTPFLTKRTLDYDYERGLTPIVVYPEITAGNPFRAPLVVRYVMNFPGLLGGDTNYSPSELLVAYSRVLADALPRSSLVLFVPASDPILFSPGEGQERSGTCYYAGKYKYFHNGQLLDITRDSIEITRDKKCSQTPQDIANIFRRSELFYCYENSALAIESVLCGCPVVFIPNQHFTKVIGESELGWDGMVWGTDPQDIERAKQTVGRGRSAYIKLYGRYREQLDCFIAYTQQKASETPYTQQVVIPYLRRPSKLLLAAGSLEIVQSIIGEKGLVEGAKVVVNRIRRKGVSMLP